MFGISVLLTIQPNIVTHFHHCLEISTGTTFVNSLLYILLSRHYMTDKATCIQLGP